MCWPLCSLHSRTRPECNQNAAKVLAEGSQNVARMEPWRSQTFEVGGAKPKVSPTGNSSSEFDVFALSRYAYASRYMRDVRDMPCMRRRARDRSITRGADLARNWAEAKAIWVVLCYCCFCCAPSRHASRGHGPCPFAGVVRTSNGILTIPGGHGKDIDPLC